MCTRLTTPIPDHAQFGTMESVMDAVSSTVSQCSSHSGSADLAQLDFNIVSLISASSQVGGLLDDILVTGQIDVNGSVLADLRQLHMCLNQLCLEYQTKLFNIMSGITDPILSSADLSEPRGRPKKIINLALVCYYSNTLVIRSCIYSCLPSLYAL